MIIIIIMVHFDVPQKAERNEFIFFPYSFTRRAA